MKHNHLAVALSMLLLSFPVVAMAHPHHDGQYCYAHAHQHHAEKPGFPLVSRNRFKQEHRYISQADQGYNDYNRKYERMNHYVKESENWRKNADQGLRNAERYANGQSEEMRRVHSQYEEAHDKYLSDRAHHAPKNVLEHDRQLADRLFHERQEEGTENHRAQDILRHTEGNDAKVRQNLENAEKWDKMDKAHRMDSYLKESENWRKNANQGFQNAERYAKGQSEGMKRVSSQYEEARDKYLSDRAHHAPKNVLEHDLQLTDRLFHERQKESAENHRAQDILRRTETNDAKVGQNLRNAENWDRVDNAQLRH